MRSLRIPIAIAIAAIISAEIGVSHTQAATIDELAERLARVEAENKMRRKRLERIKNKGVIPTQRDERKRLSTPGGFQALASAKNTAGLASNLAASWDGFYAGLSVGASAIKSSARGTLVAFPGGDPLIGIGGETTTPIFNKTASAVGPSAFVRAGYNLVVQQPLLMGIQVEAAWLGIKSQQDVLVGACSNPACREFNFSGQSAASAQWVSSILGRIGFIHERNLFYGVAGFSWGSFSTTMLTRQPPDSAFFWREATFIARGPTFGGGWERRLSDRWSATVEYRWTNFDAASSEARYGPIPSCFAGDPCYSSSVYNIRNTLQSIQLGVNRRFGSEL